MANRSTWIETEATVYKCDSAPVNGLDYSLPSVIFSYTVDGRYYSGELIGSPLEEGTKFSIRYNPARPEQNDKSYDQKWDSWGYRMWWNILFCVCFGLFVLYILLRNQ